MSILSLHDLQGISNYNYEIRVPSGHSLNVQERLNLPLWTTSTRPSNPSQGLLGFNTETLTLELWDGTRWGELGETGADGSTAARAATSAVAIKELNANATDGVYWIKPTNWSGDPIQVYCDMTTDGGGWMMIGYAGKITTDKPTTVAALSYNNGSSYWLPLFNAYGNITANAKSERAPFSRMDFAMAVPGASNTDSHCMARRTDNPNKIVIWNIASTTRWATTNDANWSFNPDPGLPITSYFKMSNTGPTGLIDKLGSANGARYENGPSYPGIAWNSSYNNNSDNVGGFTNFLSRRSILYWETGNNSYTANQWFHAQPMNLDPSSGPDNSFQDIEFYYRERIPSP